tara:strand:+ start:1088 stop:1516 length:429 start_codon:yes stop_codon:yes gene_type:complete
MKKLLSIIVVSLLLSGNGYAEYLMTSKMRGTDWGFFGFSGKNVSVDFEKIGGKFYPLYYEDRSIFIEEERVSEYVRLVNGENKFFCRIPVRPRNYILRFIHTVWSFFKDKGYYTIKDSGEYAKVRIDELIFDCIKFKDYKKE